MNPNVLKSKSNASGDKEYAATAMDGSMNDFFLPDLIDVADRIDGHHAGMFSITYNLSSASTYDDSVGCVKSI
jgi:hypothetical protein